MLLLISVFLLALYLLLVTFLVVFFLTGDEGHRFRREAVKRQPQELLLSVPPPPELSGGDALFVRSASVDVRLVSFSSSSTPTGREGDGEIHLTLTHLLPGVDLGGVVVDRKTVRKRDLQRGEQDETYTIIA